VQVFSKLAVPIASNSLVSNLANSMVTLIAGQMGSDVVAANAVVGGLWSMLWAIFWGFGCATQVPPPSPAST
jgi:MATE family multidrug resistance protein